jgi:uncharacterized protein (TIGR02145 family)
VIFILLNKLETALSMRKYLLILFCLLIVNQVVANNISITNSSLKFNSNTGWTYVAFDISWDNSWRTSTGSENWDAAWVFVKYRVPGGEWQHAKLSSNQNDHIAPLGSVITSVPDSMGVFIYRDSDGSGDVNYTGAELAWKFASGNLVEGETIEFKVQAIEMVYVPAGTFWLGDGASENTLRQPGLNLPTQISNDENIIFQDGGGGTASSIILESGISVDGDGGICTTGIGSIDNPDYPTGFSSYYFMKYEASQEQYAAFLNMLTASQAVVRYDSNNSGNYRYSLSGTHPNITATAPDRACNFISVDDMSAYADWAGLRPMTELEFEKACRGNIDPFANEYAWGTTSISSNCNVLSNDGLPNASIGIEANTGNSAYGINNGDCGIIGPLRSGIFAASSVNSTREESGSGYYGVMELSGNLREMVVSLGQPAGRLFSGQHGNGELTASGMADVLDWPTNTNISIGFRGGSWEDAAERLMTSDRLLAGNNVVSERYATNGLRCVRMASEAAIPISISPTVSTSIVEAITMATATVGGEVIFSGGDAVSESGIYYSSSPDAELTGTKLAIGSGIRVFSTSLTGLSAGTTYYIKAFATNSIETTYGNELSFITAVTVLAPTVSTTAISDITSTSATIGGEVTSDGGDEVSETGIYYSQTADAETTGTKLAIGSGAGVFSTSLIGLSEGTTYFIKAYATNSVGTSYGNELSFTAEVTLVSPTLTIATIADIASTSATVGGEVTDDGGDAVIDRGIYYSLSTDAETTGTKLAIGSGTGVFSTSLTGLTESTTYYVKAYATNSVGTAYGNEISFTTSPALDGTFIDARDGNEYRYVQIGEQVWMAENLAYLPNVSPSASGSISSPINYVYDYQGTDVTAAKSTSNYNTYGVLYNWSATLDACPDGWKLPTDADWTVLTDFLASDGHSGTEGIALKTTYGWYNNGNGTDNYGFSSFPSGYRDDGGTFDDLGTYIYFWSATQTSSSDARSRRLYYDYSYMIQNTDRNEFGFSVRCIQGEAQTAPIVTTSSATDISSTSATLGGNVTSDGGDVVSDRGVYYSTSASAETTGTKFAIGSGTGTFSTSLTGLIEGTTYYIKAYAINSIGTSYGTEVTFTTLTTPTLTTTAISGITATTAESGGDITDDGGAAVTARGVCWSTTSDPTIADNNTTDAIGTGIFTSSLTGLTSNTTYYVRAYATNSEGTSYGNEFIFITNGTVIDYDGNVYQTVVIGNQVWMAENLKVVHYRNGDALLNQSIEWHGIFIGAWSAYNNDENNSNPYGYLYNWHAVDDSRNIAPEGWHVPTDEDWKKLEMYLGMSLSEADATEWRGTNEGGKLKEAGTEHWTADFGTNETGFTALPAGYLWIYGDFHEMGSFTRFWTSTEYNNNDAWFRSMRDGYQQVERQSIAKNVGYSIRCVCDNLEGLPVVNTASVSSIGETSAASGGNITDDGGTSVTERGICWSTSAGPTLADSNTSDGTGIGVFSSSITGLSSNITYYVRAFATNPVGTSYGNELSFTTAVTLLTPTVTTIAISDIASTSATVGGEVTSDGGDAVSDRGIYYSLSADAETTGTKLTIGSGTGVFSTSLTGLTEETTYYIKSYATNSVGTSYGAEETFTTLTLPTLTTAAIRNITDVSASSGGDIADDGGATVTARGVCWSLTINPTTSDSKTVNGTGAGIFTSSLTGLTSGTTYHVRAYATNSIGTSYGNEFIFGTFTDSRDGVTYSWVQIGDQIWMAENLAYLPSVSPSSSESYTDPYYYVYGYQGTSVSTAKATANYQTYGVLYNWPASLNACPAGWHLPRDSEWTELTNILAADGHSGTEGAALKTTIAWYSSGNGTDDYGFSALPGGYRYSNSGFSSGGFGSNFWGATEYNASSARYLYLGYSYSEVNRGSNYKEFGFSVRCVEGIVTPSVTTASTITDITSTSATLGGEVSSDGGDAVPDRGIYYSLSADAESTGTKLAIGSGTGVFSTSLTGLTGATTYYIVAYSTNSVGTSYGSETSFTTLDPVVPTLTTTSINTVTLTTAESGGDITDDGGATVTERGVCWSTSTTPTISDSKTSDGPGSGSYTSSVTVLTANTTYYLRAFATNSAGTAYGEEVVLKTMNATVDDIEGNTYYTVIIGSQEWMADNLATSTLNDGSPIPEVKIESTWTATFTSAYCWPDNDIIYKDPFGALYNWYVVNTSFLCPTGWHVPSDTEWSTLTTYLGGEAIAGGKLKESGIAHWPSLNTEATNETGFTGLPGGYRLSTGVFSGGGYGFHWSSTNNGADDGWFRRLEPNSELVFRNDYNKRGGFTVRCVEGAVIYVPTTTTSTVANITSNSATVGGEVTNDGGDAVTERGIYYSLSADAETTGTKLAIGTGTGTFTSSLSGLTPNTPYYIRAYATNSVGTAYGNEINFSTDVTVPDAPTIGTATAGNAQSTVTFTPPVSNNGSAITGYTVTSSPDGITGTGSVSPITVTGLANGTAYTFTVTATNAIGTSSVSAASNSVTPSTVPGAPTIGTATKGNALATITFTAPASNGGSAITGYTVTSSPGSKTGTGTTSPITVTGLTNGTTYTFTVKATNINGNSAASSASNSVMPSVPVYDIDGNVYNTVTIGTQTWMVENLKTTKYNDGTAIPNITVDALWAVFTGAYCDYSNTPANSITYGRLYNWYAVDNNVATKVASNGGKNVCPSGWHVPSDAEWTTLTTFLGGESVAGGKLKETGTTHWWTPNTGATNETGFTALAGGYRSNNGSFLNIRMDGIWWCSTEYDLTYAYYRYMRYNYSSVARGSSFKQAGWSVRCLKD